MNDDPVKLGAESKSQNLVMTKTFPSFSSLFRRKKSLEGEEEHSWVSVLRQLTAFEGYFRRFPGLSPWFEVSNQSNLDSGIGLKVRSLFFPSSNEFHTQSALVSNVFQVGMSHSHASSLYNLIHSAWIERIRSSPASHCRESVHELPRSSPVQDLWWNRDADDAHRQDKQTRCAHHRRSFCASLHDSLRALSYHCVFLCDASNQPRRCRLSGTFDPSVDHGYSCWNECQVFWIQGSSASWLVSWDPSLFADFGKGATSLMKRVSDCIEIQGWFEEWEQDCRDERIQPSRPWIGESHLSLQITNQKVPSLKHFLLPHLWRWKELLEISSLGFMGRHQTTHDQVCSPSFKRGLMW